MKKMRENIGLFRGKRKDNGEWVKGYLVKQNYPKYHTYIIRSITANIEGKHIDIMDCDIFEVIPETIEEYTGLIDKNKMNIFEGDIIECWSRGAKERGIVTRQIGGMWVIYLAWQNGITWGLCLNDKGETDVIVIGNIHDNPELLNE